MVWVVGLAVSDGAVGALCMAAGNVCILRGGKEAIRSNRCVAKLMREALVSVELPEDCISLVQDTSHETANELMHLDGYVDVLIPRGGAGLIRAVAKEASVPVIRTGEGVCHIYVDDEADLDMAAKVLFNAKCSRPSVCNAVECVLVQEDIAKGFWEKALPLLDEKGVELRAAQRLRRSFRRDFRVCCVLRSLYGSMRCFISAEMRGNWTAVMRCVCSIWVCRCVSRDIPSRSA